MKIQASLFLFCVGFSTGALAQMGSYEIPQRTLSVYDQVQQLTAEAEARRAAFDRERQKAELYREQEFVKKAIEFVDSWNAFAEAYSHGKFDVGKARELSKEFRQLEKKGGWSRERQKAAQSSCPSRPGTDAEITSSKASLAAAKP